MTFNNLYSKRGMSSVIQVFLLVIGIVAIGYAVGSEVGGVSGEVRTPANIATVADIPVPTKSDIAPGYEEKMNNEIKNVKLTAKMLFEKKEALEKVPSPGDNWLESPNEAEVELNQKYQEKIDNIKEDKKKGIELIKAKKEDELANIKIKKEEYLKAQKAIEEIDKKIQKEGRDQTYDEQTLLTNNEVLEIKERQAKIADHNIYSNVGATSVAVMEDFGNFKQGDILIRKGNELYAKDENGHLKKLDDVAVGDSVTALLAKTIDAGTPEAPIFGGWSSWNYFGGHLVEGVLWAGSVLGAVQLVGGLVGADSEDTKVISASLTAGIMATKMSVGLFNAWGSEDKIGGGLKGLWNARSTVAGRISIGVGALVAVGVFVMMYKTTNTETYTYSCEPWEAVTRGNACEQCNNQIVPCTEYSCKALGQACELINEGTNSVECVWKNPKDVTAPVITPNEDYLLTDYEYEELQTNGVKIIYKKSTDGCIPAFTPFTFGFDTNEPAKCKIDYVRKEKMNDMLASFGGVSIFSYNHTQTMSLPGVEAAEEAGLELKNGGKFELYVKCADANGKETESTGAENEGEFAFQYCIDQSPDTTAPIIMATNPLNNKPIATNQSSFEVDVYTNEPSKCKWSTLDKKYDDMETEMTCSQRVTEVNAQGLYKCSTTLTGLESGKDNKYYFRCKDRSKNKNQNMQSFEYNLIGTKELVITSLKPAGLIKGASEVVEVALDVKTFGGYKNGEAICFYSETGKAEDYVMFFDTQDKNTHKQILNLVDGNYKYYVKCVDLGGNADTEETEFSVEADKTAPMVVRAYHEGTNLKIITSENASCVYNTDADIGCTFLFDDGQKMTSMEDVEHYVTWEPQKEYYIKCEDDYGNQPATDACSIRVRPFVR